jgi:hypothetical protein
MCEHVESTSVAAGRTLTPLGRLSSDPPVVLAVTMAACWEANP